MPPDEPIPRRRAVMGGPAPLCASFIFKAPAWPRASSPVPPLTFPIAGWGPRIVAIACQGLCTARLFTRGCAERAALNLGENRAAPPLPDPA